MEIKQIHGLVSNVIELALLVIVKLIVLHALLIIISRQDNVYKLVNTLTIVFYALI